MNDSQRLHLQKMIKANNVEDQTDLIRQLKHSVIIQNEVNNMVMLKAKYRNDPDKLNTECMQECSFLFAYYTDLYNKIKKDEIDLSILNKFIQVLKKIEDGETDQHEGSFMIGTILKELYIDSALKKSEKLDQQFEEENKKETTTVQEPIKISWRQFKNLK
jgi:hypothetical protein